MHCFWALLHGRVPEAERERMSYSSIEDKLNILRTTHNSSTAENGEGLWTACSARQILELTRPAVLQLLDDSRKDRAAKTQGDKSTELM